MMIAVALVLFTLLCLALGRSRSWSDETQAERNSLVFQSRNQAYGAYRLRTGYDSRMALAFLATVGILALAVAIPKTIARFAPAPIPAPKETVVVTVDLERVFDIPSETPKAAPPKAALATAPVKRDPDEQHLVDATDSLVASLPARDTTSTAATTTGTGPGKGTDVGAVDPGGATGQGSAGSDGGNGNGVLAGHEVQVVPQFPGGEAALGEWVRRNLDLPGDVVGKDVVYVQFTVGLDGNIEDVQAVKGKLAAYKNAAERTVRRMPKWKPARMNGHDVRCRLTLPIRFETR